MLIEFVSSWGLNYNGNYNDGIGDKQFYNPYDVIIREFTNSENKQFQLAFISDYGNSRIQIYKINKNSNNEYDDNSYKNPEFVNSINTHFKDSKNNDINSKQKINESIDFNHYKPTKLTIDNENKYLYVKGVSTHGHYVYKISEFLVPKVKDKFNLPRLGSIIKRIGGHEVSTDSEDDFEGEFFYNQYGISLSSDKTKLYVCDYNNHVVKIYNNDINLRR